MLVAQTRATIEDLILHPNVARIAENHHKHCKCWIEPARIILIYDVTETLIPFHRYHVPRSWLKPNGNILVLFEEKGGDPTQISFATKQLQSLCAHVSQSHPPQIDLWNSDKESERKIGPALLLECPDHNHVISSIKFASYGTPLGTCGNFYHGRCSSNKALSIVQKVFILDSSSLAILNQGCCSNILSNDVLTGLHWIKKL